jgi:hypothetical protein
MGAEAFFSYVRSNPINSSDSRGLFKDGTRYGPHRTDYLGHSDFEGSNRFDFTLEDHLLTLPFVEPFAERHFRCRSEVEKDLRRSIDRCSPSTFERLMHQGQDTFVHWDKGYRNGFFSGWHPKYYLPGHPFSNPDRDDVAWGIANKWTSKWVSKWDENCGGICDR